LTNELTWFGAVTFLMVVMCIWFFHAPLEHHANPLVTPLHTTAPWYFLWLQGLLKLGDKIFFGLVIPSVLLGLFFIWPYLDVGTSRRYTHRRFALSMMLLFITGMLFLTYMGTPKYGVETTGDQEVGQNLAPVEGVGPVRALAFEDYRNGTYCTDDLDEPHALKLVEWGAAPLPVPLYPDTSVPVMCQPVPDSMRGLMEEYQSQISSYDDKLPNMVGILNVMDWQTGLKRVDIKMIWNVPDLDANKNLQKNADGSIKFVQKQYQVPELDANGLPRRDASGNITGSLTPVTAAAVSSSGKTLFLNQDSEYHQNAG
ncbi:MAG TPA: hypothetical protein VMT34_07370, partial [Aggregatilineales bacterium]|nr:hypothetical protein [Aggregatilineales bacterium]